MKLPIRTGMLPLAVAAFLSTAQVTLGLYDPFGSIPGQSRPLAHSNTNRFSSKEFHAESSLSYYLPRFYDPSLQRWINRDRINEQGGLNLYGFVNNNPINWIDVFGLTIFPLGFIGPIQPGDGYPITSDIA